MRLLFYFICLNLAFSQADRIPKKLQQRMLSSPEIRFIGVDPNQAFVPEFQLAAHVNIDTSFVSYMLNVETSIRLLNLSRQPDGLNHKYAYKIMLSIQHEEDSDSIKQSKYKSLTTPTVDSLNVLFNEDRHLFNFRHLKPGNYTITADIEDEFTGIRTRQKRRIDIRDAKDEPILISDPILIEAKTNQRIVSNRNAFLNRLDSIKIQFSTFAKDPNESYLLLLRNYRRINSNRFPDRSLIEFEKDFYSFEKRYKTYQFNYAKSNYDHYEVNLGLKNQIRQKLDITANRYVTEVTREDIDSDDFVLADTLANENFNQNIALTSETTNVYLENLNYYAETLFTFSWDTIPNTEYEMEQFSGKMKIVLSDSLYDVFDEANFEQKKQIFREYWLTQSQHNQQEEGYVFLLQYKEKVKFAINNFFDFHNGIGIIRKEPFFNNGWRSEKGLLYLKYGLPDEIYGENFIDKDGSLKMMQELPIQKWVYYHKNRVYVFLGNKKL